MELNTLENNQKYQATNFGAIIIFSGSATLVASGDREITVKKRSFLITNIPFEISTASPYLDGYFVAFGMGEDDRLQGVISGLNKNQTYFHPFRLSAEDSIKELITSLSRNKTDKALANSYAHILLSKLRDQIEYSEGNSTSVFEKFNLLIEDNLQHNYCAGEYAEMLDVPITSLIAEVKSEAGKTPCKVITEKVIDYAQKRLLNSNDSSKVIAYQLGFDDPYYFIKYFKKNVGLTPTQFRKREQVEV